MRHRVLAKDSFKFSDRTTVPYGSFLVVPGRAPQHDAANYQNGDEFADFRFSRMREERGTNLGTNDENIAEGGAGSGVFNRQMISTAPDHIIFGHGMPGMEMTDVE
ncbi:hypothetical protein C8F04DRAFT_1272748 [Mycena alexandri]|uniref:Uncharacterized protein n=1 Tax=Mycena alexandri TaxID=1745969 RepID=A0AAD6S8H1_9AGAR|nr:hypothetical protein C8F04DRAFT_1272748 [Mycena alexandri]